MFYAEIDRCKFEYPSNSDSEKVKDNISKQSIMLVEIMAKGTTGGQRRLPEKKLHIF